MIIGAGIAGLTLGLACQRAGLEVKIYEKAAALKT
ncbi:MAG TPA: NAD(P)-binding protein, partial [Gammaproteobacteria bacterium]|nr:NAD(P)-binding protein [Gammaproteobacteria bacterium]